MMCAARRYAAPPEISTRPSCADGQSNLFVKTQWYLSRARSYGVDISSGRCGIRLSALTAFFNHVGVEPASPAAVWASLSMATPRDARGLDSAEASGVGPLGFSTAR